MANHPVVVQRIDAQAMAAGEDAEHELLTEPIWAHLERPVSRPARAPLHQVGRGTQGNYLAAHLEKVFEETYKDLVAESNPNHRVASGWIAHPRRNIADRRAGSPGVRRRGCLESAEGSMRRINNAAHGINNSRAAAEEPDRRRLRDRHGCFGMSRHLTSQEKRCCEHFFIRAWSN